MTPNYCNYITVIINYDELSLILLELDEYKYQSPTLSVIFQDKATHFKSIKINEEGENGL